ncbi:DUF6193 family natural product biosynthesis protein [Streptomyces luteolus]|uniref:DUF6193 family natural product biosynthesis protein n=1 Tax=Streptomyces luteolus TaxID=3043615 RepID=A0ABT6T2C0_9ACTN|nr:DUF6193 family natural product biosynthesis protein [Streptomyces sp. B-S-A12]MDI3421760.1 DUF6193 family natural product biosynthesis protein [Streptomyces sp. B-S-A12]
MTSNERSPYAAAEIVEARWQQVLSSGHVDQELAQAAYERPELRELYPWTGMWELHFSRCTEQRWTWDIPYVAPAKDGRWAVGGPARSEFVGWADTIDEALSMVIARLPPSCGPAFAGTPSELAEYEAQQGQESHR